MGIKESVISNTIYLFLDTFVVTIFSFLYWVLIGKTLLPENYGIIVTSTNLMSLLALLFLFGINVAAQKLIPEYTEQKDEKKIASLVKFSFRLTTIANIILALILIIFSVQISNIFKLPLTVLYITAAGTFISAIATISGSITYGLQKMKKYFLSDLVGHSAKIIFSFAIFILGFAFYGPLIGYLIFLFLLFILRFEKKWLFIKSDKVDVKEVFLKYSFTGFIFVITSLVYTSFQYVLLPLLTTQTETGLFAVANKITYFLSLMPVTITSALFPTVSGLEVYRKAKKLQARIINLGLKYSFFLSLPFISLLVIFSRAIILVFSSQNYSNAFALFLPLSLSFFFYGLAYFFINGLYAIRKPHLMRNISIITALAFLVTSIPLTIMLGVLGMAYATLITMSIMLFVSLFYLEKFLKISLQLNDIIKITIANAILLSLFIFIDVLEYSFFFKLILVVISLLLYPVILMLLRFFTKDDVEIFYFLENRLPFLRKQIKIFRNVLLKYI